MDGSTTVTVPPLDAPGTALASAASGQRRVPAWVEAFLRAPLVTKIAGANAVIVVAALASAMGFIGNSAADRGVIVVMLVALLWSLVVNVVLVVLALRPLGELETTAQRIWRGDLEARVPRSLLADRNMLRIGGTLNVLLDGLTSDRIKLRALAFQVLHAGDVERARIARELHDSSAQTLAGLLFELSALASLNQDSTLAERIERIRRMTAGVLDELKLLAHTVYPRILDDRGLVPALEHLARETEERTDTRVEVNAEDGATDVPKDYTSALYRVAQEAVNNAIRHGHPSRIMIHVGARQGVARLEVVDDGAGFDVREAEERRPGMGLFTMRERAALLGGGVEIHSTQALGTRVVLTVPLERAPEADDALVASATRLTSNEGALGK